MTPKDKKRLLSDTVISVIIIFILVTVALGECKRYNEIGEYRINVTR